MKIYIYWKGDESKIKDQLDFFKKSNLDYELGPSEKDHNFLMKNYKYYRDSYNLNKYSFCSDVWRVYKLSKNPGIYLDLSSNFGDKFSDYLEQIWRHKRYLAREDRALLSTTIMSTRIKNDPIYKDILSKIFKTAKLPKFNFIFPVLFSYYMFDQKYCDKRWTPSDYPEFYIDDVNVFNQKGAFEKFGFGSWIHKKGNNSGIWVKIIKNYNNRKESKVNERYYKIIGKQGYNSFNPHYIRENYDIAESYEQVLEAKEAYKGQHSVKFSEKLIWSKFYRFFTFKWF